MSILIMMGDTPRHFFMARAVAASGRLKGLILETRERHPPVAPAGIPPRTLALFEQHFADPHHFNQSVMFEVSWLLDLDHDEHASLDLGEGIFRRIVHRTQRVQMLHHENFCHRAPLGKCGAG